MFDKRIFTLIFYFLLFTTKVHKCILRQKHTHLGTINWLKWWTVHLEKENTFSECIAKTVAQEEQYFWRTSLQQILCPASVTQRCLESIGVLTDTWCKIQAHHWKQNLWVFEHNHHDNQWIKLSTKWYKTQCLPSSLSYNNQCYTTSPGTWWS